MSFIHHLYIGHFEHEGKYVRFAGSATDRILKPVASRPLEMDVVQRVIRELNVNGCELADSQLPVDWPISEEDGYLVCDQCSLSEEAVAFIVRVCKETGCELVDFNSRLSITVEDLSSRCGNLSRRKPSGAETCRGGKVPTNGGSGTRAEGGLV